MYNTAPPPAPATSEPEDLKKYLSTLYQYMTQMFRIGNLITQLPNTSILDSMVSSNDKGQEGKIFYVSDGTTGTFYRTFLEAGILAYEVF